MRFQGRLALLDEGLAQQGSVRSQRKIASNEALHVIQCDDRLKLKGRLRLRGSVQRWASGRQDQENENSFHGYPQQWKNLTTTPRSSCTNAQCPLLDKKALGLA